MGRITHDSKNNYSEIYILGMLCEGMWDANKRIARRLRDNKRTPRDHWWILADIAEAKVLTESWKNLAKYLETAPDDTFGKFFEIHKSNKIDFSKFLDITRYSKASGEDLFIFYRNISYYYPRYKKEGFKNNESNLKRIRNVIKLNPKMDLLSLGYIFNFEDYKPKFSKEL